MSTVVGARVAAAGLALVEDAEIRGRVTPPALVGPGCRVAEHAARSAGEPCWAGASRSAKAPTSRSSVILDGATIGAHTTINGSIIGPEASVGEHCRIEGLVILGHGVRIGTRQRPGGRCPYLARGGTARRSDQLFERRGDLSRERIEQVDPTGQLNDILDMPEHLRDAQWRVESAGLAARDCRGGLVVARDGRLVDRRGAGSRHPGRPGRSARSGRRAAARYRDEPPEAGSQSASSTAAHVPQESRAAAAEGGPPPPRSRPAPRCPGRR